MRFNRFHHFVKQNGENLSSFASFLFFVFFFIKIDFVVVEHFSILILEEYGQAGR